MTAQDTNFSLTLSRDGSEEMQGSLKLQHNNGNVSLSFYRLLPPDANKPNARPRTAQMAEFVCQLIEFTMIEFQKQKLVLKGPKQKLELQFKKDTEKDNFFEYITQKVKLVQSDCNPLVFLFETLDGSPVTYYGTALPRTTFSPNVMFNRISLERISCIASKYGPIQKATELDDPNQSLENFYNRIIPTQFQFQILKTLLQVEENKVEQYSLIKKQWTSIFKEQWDNFYDLQKLVYILEEDILKNEPLFQGYENVEQIQKHAFNILLTTSFFNWDKASYEEGFVKFLIPFISAIISKSNGQEVTLTDGTTCDHEEAESLVFWTFWSFFETNSLNEHIKPAKQPVIKRWFNKVGLILEKNFQDLLKLLLQKHVFCLDFLAEDINSFFYSCFSGNDLFRFWISMLAFKKLFPCTSENDVHFMQVMIISLLLSLGPEFVKMNPMSYNEFIKNYQNLKKKLNLDELLTYTLSISNELAKLNN